jgi:hypothetical protein
MVHGHQNGGGPGGEGRPPHAAKGDGIANVTQTFEKRSDVCEQRLTIRCGYGNSPYDPPIVLHGVLPFCRDNRKIGLDAVFCLHQYLQFTALPAGAD